MPKHDGAAAAALQAVIDGTMDMPIPNDPMYHEALEAGITAHAAAAAAGGANGSSSGGGAYAPHASHAGGYAPAMHGLDLLGGPLGSANSLLQQQVAVQHVVHAAHQQDHLNLEQLHRLRERLVMVPTGPAEAALKDLPLPPAAELHGMPISVPPVRTSSLDKEATAKLQKFLAAAALGDSPPHSGHSPALSSAARFLLLDNAGGSGSVGDASQQQKEGARSSDGAGAAKLHLAHVMQAHSRASGSPSGCYAGSGSFSPVSAKAHASGAAGALLGDGALAAQRGVVLHHMEETEEEETEDEPNRLVSEQGERMEEDCDTPRIGGQCGGLQQGLGTCGTPCGVRGRSIEIEQDGSQGNLGGQREGNFAGLPIVKEEPTACAAAACAAAASAAAGAAAPAASKEGEEQGTEAGRYLQEGEGVDAHAGGLPGILGLAPAARDVLRAILLHRQRQQEELQRQQQLEQLQRQQAQRAALRDLVNRRNLQTVASLHQLVDAVGRQTATAMLPSLIKLPTVQLLLRAIQVEKPQLVASVAAEVTEARRAAAAAAAEAEAQQRALLLLQHAELRRILLQRLQAQQLRVQQAAGAATADDAAAAAAGAAAAAADSSMQHRQLQRRRQVGRAAAEGALGATEPSVLDLLANVDAAGLPVAAAGRSGSGAASDEAAAPMPPLWKEPPVPQAAPVSGAEAAAAAAAKAEAEAAAAASHAAAAAAAAASSHATPLAATAAGRAQLLQLLIAHKRQLHSAFSMAQVAQHAQQQECEPPLKRRRTDGAEGAVEGGTGQGSLVAPASGQGCRDAGAAGAPMQQAEPQKGAASGNLDALAEAAEMFG